MASLIGHPAVTGIGSVLTVVLAESSGGSTRADIALGLGVITAAGTLYGIFDRERNHHEGQRKRRRR